MIAVRHAPPLAHRQQVEERLKFYDTGEAPRKNIDVMKEVMDELKVRAAQYGLCSRLVVQFSA